MTYTDINGKERNSVKSSQGIDKKAID